MKYNKIICLIVLGLLFGIYYNNIISNLCLINNSPTEEINTKINTDIRLKNLKKSGFWTLDEIIIDDNGGGGITWDTAKNQDWCNLVDGVYIIENVTFTVTDNSGSGLTIRDSDKFFIIKNCTAKSGNVGYDAGITLVNTRNGRIINNSCSNNKRAGIYLLNGCVNNTISRNTAKNNFYLGVGLDNNCNNNNISDSIVNGMGYGVRLTNYCRYNNISRNIANDNDFGIEIYYGCHNNTIMGNSVYDNGNYGIQIWSNCSYNSITGNAVNNDDTYNQYTGINIHSMCDFNRITNNTMNNNILYGLCLATDCDNNNITENYIYNNGEYSIFIDTDCDNTGISRNLFYRKNADSTNDYIDNKGSNTNIGFNYYLPGIPSLYINVIDQSFLKTKFTIIINISSSLDFVLWPLSFQIWWNGEIIPSNDIDCVGIRSYKITLTPIFVKSGGNPVLLNMTIKSANHENTYFEFNIAVEQPLVIISDDDNDDDDKEGEKFSISEFLISPLGMILSGSICFGGFLGVVYLIRRRFSRK